MKELIAFIVLLCIASILIAGSFGDASSTCATLSNCGDNITGFPVTADSSGTVDSILTRVRMENSGPDSCMGRVGIYNWSDSSLLGQSDSVSVDRIGCTDTRMWTLQSTVDVTKDSVYFPAIVCESGKTLTHVAKEGSVNDTVWIYFYDVGDDCTAALPSTFVPGASLVDTLVKIEVWYTTAAGIPMVLTNNVYANPDNQGAVYIEGDQSNVYDK